MASIPNFDVDRQRYEDWLLKKRRMLRKWDHDMRNFVLPIDKHALKEMCQVEEYSYGRPVDAHTVWASPQLIPDTFRNRDRQRLRSPELSDLFLHRCMKCTGYVPYHSDFKSEWMYTLDLDLEIFSINNFAHFQLRHIPRDLDRWSGNIGRPYPKWIRAMELAFIDKNGQPAFPRSIPQPPNLILRATRYIANKCIATEAMTALSASSSMRILRNRARAIRYLKSQGFEDFDLNGFIRPAVNFLACIWTAFLKDEFCVRLSQILHRLRPEEFIFRETAFAMISIAMGLTQTLRHGSNCPEDDKREDGIKRPCWAEHLGGDTAYFAAELGSRYHETDIGAGSAPRATTYWRKGILIRLAINLDDDNVVLTEIEKARALAQKPGRRVLDILLFSIKHIVIVRVDEDIKRRTRALLLYDINAPYVKHPPLHRSDRRQLRVFRGRRGGRSIGLSTLNYILPFSLIEDRCLYAIVLGRV